MFAPTSPTSAWQLKISLLVGSACEVVIMNSAGGTPKWERRVGWVGNYRLLQVAICQDCQSLSLSLSLWHLPQFEDQKIFQAPRRDKFVLPDGTLEAASSDIGLKTRHLVNNHTLMSPFFPSWKMTESPVG